MTDTTPPTEYELLRQQIARLDASAYGFVTGVMAGLGLLAATLILVAKGGPAVGRTLGLLAHYFPGYSVTVGGAFIGFAYAFVSGYAAGYLVGFVYNRIVARVRAR